MHNIISIITHYVIHVHTYYMYIYICAYIHIPYSGFLLRGFNLAIGSIRDIKIRDHFIRDIL